jgi:hypothetical protein
VLFAGAASLALTNAYLWNSTHIHISGAIESAGASSSMAVMGIGNQMAGIFGPLLGGIIAGVFGTPWLIVTALMFATAAFVPLRNIGNLGISEYVATPVRYTLTGAPWGDLAANFCFNFNASVGGTVWPIYLAVIIGTFRGIGAISAFAAMAAVVVIWVAGHRGDRGHDREVLFEGSAVSSASHVLRLAVSAPLGLSAVSALFQGALSYLSNAWTSTYYLHARQRGLPYIVSMEIACDISYAALWGMVYLLSLAVSVGVMFVTTFLLAALASWGHMLMTKRVAVSP